MTAPGSCRWDGDDLVLTVRVTPRASRNLVEVREGIVWVRITAPPVDGKANKAVSRLLAKTFGVAPSRVSLEHGESGRTKRLRIREPAHQPDWLEALLH
jgi:uncharacterized protein (TIGR00251 family)